MCGSLSCVPYWGPGPQPRHEPNWESNLQPIGSQASTQSTEPHQPGPNENFKGDSDAKFVVLSYAQLLTLVQVQDFYKNLSHNKKVQQKYHVLSIANAKNYKRENGMVDMSQNTQELPN